MDIQQTLMVEETVRILVDIAAKHELPSTAVPALVEAFKRGAMYLNELQKAELMK